ncbi:MAG: ATP-dependent protease subunit HslV [Deltaproteobacteria bacterium]|jgi:ATP-dependent HslUV protease subunit HslV|nr:ATP-dependent protease subunit HslV [Deltaproteobacteria bacterium]
MHATTILAVRHNGQVAVCGDGQVSMGNTIAKSTAKKVRRVNKDRVLCGFAGTASDAFTILELFEEHLERFPSNLPKACVELAKEWRLDRRYRRLDAVLLACDATDTFQVSGNGDVLEPDDNVMAIGSGGSYALSAARAMVRHAPKMSAPDIAREALKIASEICLYTNDHLVLEVIDSQ